MIYTENLYIIVWAILFLFWLGTMFLAYTRSSPANAVRNIAIAFLAGVLLIFIVTATNPIRKNNTVKVNPMNFTIPEQREVPDRIIIEPRLTDKKRAESLQSLRESSRMREQYEFGEVIAEDKSDEAEENKGD